MKLKSNKTRTILITMAFTCISIVAQGASYQFGDKGGEVTNIQKKLIAHGYKARLNGEYDKETKWAVRLFQKDQGLPIDGVVGSATYKKLMGKEIPQVDKQVVKASKEEIAKAIREDAKKVTKIELKQKAEEPKKRKKKTDEELEEVLDYSTASYRNASKSIKEMIDYAHKFKGVPYVFGGNTPKGFDCSGYTKYVFAKAGVTLPRMAEEQYKVGKKVSRGQLKAGDLVFFETYEPGISHSGIYIGEGKFISATSSRGVAVDSLMDGYWGKRYRGATRVLS